MGRAPCCDKNGLKKGPWTPEEDQKLIDYIQKNGYGNWRTLPKNAGLQRCGKSCRLRWTNYLRPDIKRGRFSFEEEETIIQLHSILGNKWSAIAARLPGRTDNEIKNYWNTHIRKRLLRMGIDPVTHSPRLDLLDLSSILNSSLYNPSHMNLSRLLGVQPLVNPELIRLATSLLSSHQRQNHHQNLALQNNSVQENNQLSSPQVVPPPQLPPLVHQPSCQVQDIPANCIPFSTGDQAQLMQQHNVDQHFSSSSLTNFNNSQNCQPNDLQWQTSDQMQPNWTEDHYVPSFDHQNYDCYNNQSILEMEPPPSDETSTFQSNNSNNFSFQSVLSNLSTPSSSPTPLNSNSTYISTTEDEKESYCSNLLKFEMIPDILNVTEFM